MLNGKEAICYPGFENALKGASLSEQKVVQSGNVFTAKAAGVAIEFALRIVENIKGADVAKSIRELFSVDKLYISPKTKKEYQI